MYWIEKNQNKAYFSYESNFCKAIQVNAKLMDFNFELKVEYISQYGREARRISDSYTANTYSESAVEVHVNNCNLVHTALICSM